MCKNIFFYFDNTSQKRVFDSLFEDQIKTKLDLGGRLVTDKARLRKALTVVIFAFIRLFYLHFDRNTE